MSEAKAINDIWHHFARLNAVEWAGACSVIFCYARDRGIKIIPQSPQQREDDDQSRTTPIAPARSSTVEPSAHDGRVVGSNPAERTTTSSPASSSTVEPQPEIAALIKIALLPVGAETKDARQIAMTALDWYQLDDVAASSPAEPAKDDLRELIAKGVAWFEALTPEQQEEHLKAQCESWVRGEMALDRKPDATTRRMPKPSPNAGLVERLRAKSKEHWARQTYDAAPLLDEAADALEAKDRAFTSTIRAQDAACTAALEAKDAALNEASVDAEAWEACANDWKKRADEAQSKIEALEAELIHVREEQKELRSLASQVDLGSPHRPCRVDVSQN